MSGLLHTRLNAGFAPSRGRRPLRAHCACVRSGPYLGSRCKTQEDATSRSDQDTPAVSNPPIDRPDDLGGHPSRIGAYRIVRPLGRGGMGVVYLAEQTEPVRREVAIKVLSTGVDSDVFAARFEAERQTLALMQHPNITNVFDAGVTDDGLPYFVMERVTGVALTEYCDEHRLGVDDRIALFMQICRAVQHAHQKGIVHRDLKPSNVIVAESEGAPVCKVIDFGIAKTVGPEAARLTITGISLGTPAYMSPEQARGDADVDTRADVYSLGVTLYELLAGVLPFDSKTSFSMMMMTQHGDARAPSQRLAALPAEQLARIAARRGVSPEQLLHQLREDLDWIVHRGPSESPTAKEFERRCRRFARKQPRIKVVDDGFDEISILICGHPH